MTLPGEDNARADVESGVYERERPLNPGDVVLDVGAHVGYFTERALKAGASRVIAVEPSPENYNRLCERVVSSLAVTPLNVAALDENGKAILHLSTLNSGAHSLVYDHQNGDVSVSCIDIGAWVAPLNPTFAKIDCESSEGRVIASLLRAGLRPFITFEAHSEALYTLCKHQLVQDGYRFVDGDSPVGVHWAYPPD